MSLTEQGFYRPSFDEIVVSMEQRAKEMLGEDIDTTEQSILGKFIRIIGYDLSNCYNDLEKVYYSAFPNTATGISLDRLAPFAGILRNGATIARHNITVTGTPDTTVEMGELLVSSQDGVTFYNENNFTIGENGTVNIIVAAEEYGAIGNVDNIDVIVNPVVGVTGITYIGLEEVGENVESDYDLRQRFAIAVSGAGTCNEDSIRGSIARIPDIDSVIVITNETSEADSYGRPPHSLEVYIYGGEENEQEIANVIFEKKPLGIKAVTTADSEHAVTRQVIDKGGYPHEISFSKVTEVTIDINVTIKTNMTYTAEGATAIKNNLVEYVSKIGVGGSCVTSAMYGSIFAVAGVTEVVSITQAKTGEEPSPDTIVCRVNEVPKTTATNITVTVISA